MAKKAQGTTVYMHTAAATGKVITGVTQANPAVVTCPAHGFSNGDVIWIDNVVGMQELNKRAFVIANVDGSPEGTATFELKGVNSTNYTAWSTGGSPETGTASKCTLTAIGEVSGIPEMGGTEPNPIDVSHLQSVASETLAGLPRQSNISFNIWFDIATAGHSSLLLANEDLEDRVFKFSQSTWNMTVVAQVGGVRISAGDVNSAISGTVTLLPRAAGAWSTV